MYLNNKLNNRLKRLLFVLLTVAALVAATASPTSAFTIIGSSTGSAGSANLSGGNPDYAVMFTSGECVGYRVTIVDAAGTVKEDSIDIFRKTTAGQAAFNGYYEKWAQRIEEQTSTQE